MAEALSVLMGQARRLAPRSVGLGEALGLRLARGVAMDMDSPPFDRSMLDGYAVRSVDAIAGAQLRVVARVDAGARVALPGGKVGQGECVAINTGAEVPTGADAVLMVEHSKAVEGSGEFVQVLRGVAAGWGVQRRGSDAVSGQEVLPAGKRLTPENLAVCAAAGAARVEVEDPRPVAALLTTGDEVVPPEVTPGPGQIRNSNHIMLASLLKVYGLPTLDLGTVRDEEKEIRARLERGLAEADVTVVTVGMSMGTKDHVPRLLREMGMAFHVEKVRIKPGKPFVFATRDDGDGRRRYVVGLPGNPVSAYVCFVRLVVPLLAGLDPTLPGPKRVVEQAYVDSDLPANGDREFYQPCVITTKGPPWAVTPLNWRGSADLFTLSRADAMIIHPAGAAAQPAQSVVDILHLRA